VTPHSRNLRETINEAGRVLQESLATWEGPAAVIQTGTGFEYDGLFDEILADVPLHVLPGIPDDHSPAGHRLRILLGRCGDRQVLLFHGRRHLYEGYGPLPCVLPVCAAVRAGVRRVFLLSAAGGIREDLRPGMLMVLTDYINNLGASPLVGNQDLGATPFPEMGSAFSQELNAAFVNAAADVGLAPRLGVYQANLGPQFETPAEVAAARRNGADAVGMSVVLETIAARTMGAEVAAVALISNMAASYKGRPPDHADTVEAGRYCSPLIMRALRVCIREHL